MPVKLSSWIARPHQDASFHVDPRPQQAKSQQPAANYRFFLIDNDSGAIPYVAAVGKIFVPPADFRPERHPHRQFLDGPDPKTIVEYFPFAPVHSQDDFPQLVEELIENARREVRGKQQNLFGAVLALARVQSVREGLTRERFLKKHGPFQANLAPDAYTHGYAPWLPTLSAAMCKAFDGDKALGYLIYALDASTDHSPRVWEEDGRIGQGSYLILPLSHTRAKKDGLILALSFDYRLRHPEFWVPKMLPTGMSIVNPEKLLDADCQRLIAEDIARHNLIKPQSWTEVSADQLRAWDALADAGIQLPSKAWDPTPLTALHIARKQTGSDSEADQLDARLDEITGNEDLDRAMNGIDWTGHLGFDATR